MSKNAEIKPVLTDDDPAAAVEDFQRRLVRERMLGMWRSAVETVGVCVEAEHKRAHREALPSAPTVPRQQEPRQVATWKRPAWCGPAN